MRRGAARRRRRGTRHCARRRDSAARGTYHRKRKRRAVRGDLRRRDGGRRCRRDVRRRLCGLRFRRPLPPPPPPAFENGNAVLVLSEESQLQSSPASRKRLREPSPPPVFGGTPMALAFVCRPSPGAAAGAIGGVAAGGPWVVGHRRRHGWRGCEHMQNMSTQPDDDGGDAAMDGADASAQSWCPSRAWPASSVAAAPRRWARAAASADARDYRGARGRARGSHARPGAAAPAAASCAPRGAAQCGTPRAAGSVRRRRACAVRRRSAAAARAGIARVDVWGDGHPVDAAAVSHMYGGASGPAAGLRHAQANAVDGLDRIALRHRDGTPIGNRIYRRHRRDG